MELKAHSGLNVVYTYDLDGLEVFWGRNGEYSKRMTCDMSYRKDFLKPFLVYEIQDDFEYLELEDLDYFSRCFIFIFSFSFSLLALLCSVPFGVSFFLIFHLAPACCLDAR